MANNENAKEQPVRQAHRRRLSKSQMVLIGLMLFFAVLLAFGLLQNRRQTTENRLQKTEDRGQRAEDRRQTNVTDTLTQNQRDVVKVQDDQQNVEQPVSLQRAYDFEGQNNYEQALEIYRQLSKQMPRIDARDEMLADFIGFKTAMCLAKLSKDDEAAGILRGLGKSRSAAIRCLSAYNSIGFQTSNKQYLAAMSNVYRCLGLLEVLNLDTKQSAQLTRSCNFLAGQCLTANVLNLTGGDEKVPQELWINRTGFDPFTSSQLSQILSLLEAGSVELSRASLSPVIFKAEGSERWQVTCSNATVEEVLSRFAAKASLELKWNLNGKGAANSSNEGANIRNRLITLNLSLATASQIVTMAAGCAALVATVDDTGLITVSSPADAGLLSEQLKLCSEQAFRLWQQYLVQFDQDELTANVHFALGLLYYRGGEIPKAITEFKMVSNRFARSPLASYALFNSSMLRTNIKDYKGAREELLQLVEQHPDSQLCDEAIYYLADATMKATLFSEARPLYKKLYDLNLSRQSRIQAAWGLGQCLFEEKEHEESIKWLSQYVNLAAKNGGENTDKPDENIYKAYLLMGKAYLGLGKGDQACRAFEYALAGKFSPEQYVQIISALVDSYVMRQKFVEALKVCDGVEAWKLTVKENIQVLLLKSMVLRRMGLIERALSAIGDRAEYVVDSKLKAQILYEQALLFRASERFEFARRNLSEIISITDDTSMRNDAALELADVCRIGGRNSEAVSLCIGILETQPPDEIKKRALSILTEAYRSQKDYDNALLAVMGQWQTSKK